jgi:hypothetical protein
MSAGLSNVSRTEDIGLTAQNVRGHARGVSRMATVFDRYSQNRSCPPGTLASTLTAPATTPGVYSLPLGNADVPAVGHITEMRSSTVERKEKPMHPPDDLLLMHERLWMAREAERYFVAADRIHHAGPGTSLSMAEAYQLRNRGDAFWLAALSGIASDDLRDEVHKAIRRQAEKGGV